MTCEPVMNMEYIAGHACVNQSAAVWVRKCGMRWSDLRKKMGQKNLKQIMGHDTKNSPNKWALSIIRLPTMQA